MPTHYENFDLWIEGTQEGYRTRVDSSVGQATAKFVLPFSAAEQAAIIAANWGSFGIRVIRCNFNA